MKIILTTNEGLLVETWENVEGLYLNKDLEVGRRGGDILDGEIAMEIKKAVERRDVIVNVKTLHDEDFDEDYKAVREGGGYMCSETDFDSFLKTKWTLGFKGRGSGSRRFCCYVAIWARFNY